METSLENQDLTCEANRHGLMCFLDGLPCKSPKKEECVKYLDVTKNRVKYAHKSPTIDYRSLDEQ